MPLVMANVICDKVQTVELPALIYSE